MCTILIANKIAQHLIKKFQFDNFFFSSYHFQCSNLFSNIVQFSYQIHNQIAQFFKKKNAFLRSENKISLTLIQYIHTQLQRSIFNHGSQHKHSF